MRSLKNSKGFMFHVRHCFLFNRTANVFWRLRLQLGNERENLNQPVFNNVSVVVSDEPMNSSFELISTFCDSSGTLATKRHKESCLQSPNFHAKPLKTRTHVVIFSITRSFANPKSRVSPELPHFIR